MSNILKLLFFALTLLSVGCAKAQTIDTAAPLPAQMPRGLLVTGW
jgi:hypothetical protein